ncbi:MAG: ParB/RepB/Spo0J family partition protein [Bacteroidota bacterium]|nr:ParB/RepB/Spo0J family partition protein [Bacteroidota bacterium]MDP4233367.1 ParB/RepB/Spo0J family partition protein [Bacteroidota bacterium]MDP4242233.1 ParB/RepB/Spo0J family partition protein [Bacteroidota bacterium]MDP4286989.1 ParB/RepB/Spo0J family partition protein [Bacteroidota bacterium]
MSKTRSVLGKGLSALIPGAEAEERVGGIELDEVSPELRSRPAAAASPRTGPYLAMVEIARIAPNPLQPRKEFSKESLEDLTQSIRTHGVIQPVTVRRAGDQRFELISGERRIRASIEAGLTHVPAYVLEVEGDRKMLEMAIVENVQREQFNPVEEAEAYQRLIEDCGLTQEDVAERISKDRTTVANSIRLLRLPESIKDSLRAGELSTGHAKAVLAVESHEKQVELWQVAVRDRLSVRKLEELARLASSKPSAVQGSTQGERASGAKRIGGSRVENNGRSVGAGDADSETSIAGVRELETSLQRNLGTQVKIRMKPDKTGEVAIQFYSLEDLERLQELLSSVREA